MGSKILFMGTAGDNFVVAKQLRASAGIILNLSGFQFHIDPGPATLIRAIENQINLRENTAVLVSNSEVINCNDINVEVNTMTHSGLDKKGVLICNESLVKGNDKIHPFLTSKHKNYVERVIALEPGQKVGVENVEIHALKTNNEDSTALGFKFYTPHFILSYTGDTGYSDDVVRQYFGSDIIIMNVPFPRGIESEYNLNVDDVVKIIKKVNPKLVILTHFGYKMLKADPIYEAREVQRVTNCQVITAKDGMLIVPDEYSAKSRQQMFSGLKEFKSHELDETKSTEKPSFEQETTEKGEEEQVGLNQFNDSETN